MKPPTDPALELEDIQVPILRARPAPFAGAYLFLRIDDREAGRDLLRRLAGVITTAAPPAHPEGDARLSIALTFRGLEALGVPRRSLDTFAPEFQQGMAARAEVLGDVGACSPAHWEKPFD